MAELRNDERSRLAALAELGVLDTPPSAEFEALARAAASVCDTPISLITLVDKDRQWFKANIGFDDTIQTPRAVSFCAHAIENEGIFEVKDACADPRFLDNPLVTEEPSIRFYAGATLRLSNGAHIGTLCVIDKKARELTDRQRETLQHLSEVVVHALEAMHVTRKLANSEARFRTLTTLAPLGIFSTDPDGACTYTNERWQTIFKMGHNEAIGHGWSRALHPEDRDDVNSEWTHAATTHCEFDMEFRILHPNGDVVNVRMISRPIVSQQGEIAGHVGSVENVNARFVVQRTLFEERRRLKSIIEGTSAGTWEWNIQTGEMHFNSRWADMLGMTLGELEPITVQTWYSLVHPDDAIKSDMLLDEHLAGSTDTFDCEVRMRNKSGGWIWVQLRGRVLTKLSDGRPEWMFGTQLDITRRRQQEQALLNSERLLAEQHELLQVTLQSIGDAVITSDASGLVTWLNPAAEHMTGWMSADAKGQRLSQVFRIIDEETRQQAENPVEACLRHNGVMSLANRTVLVARNGSEFGIDDSAAPIRSNSGELLGVVLVFHDVTEQRRHSNEMRYRATHDQLTGLVNRSEFETRLRIVIENACQNPCEHVLLYIDLDQFKLVNDACGHSEGDQLLIKIAKLLGNVLRVGDTLARLGGDEFGAILKNCSCEQAKDIAQKICDQMDEFRFEHEKRRFRIGTSIGLVPIDGRWDNLKSALRAADTACYAAKEAGRNRVHVWFDTDRAMQARRKDLQWASRLEQALDNDSFVLFAQRIESATSPGSALHAEVLIRLCDIDGNLTQPSVFLSAAERFNMATRLDRWVLEKSVNVMMQLSDISKIDTLYINLSGQSVSDHEFHKYAVELLAQAGSAFCQRICLEITETAAITNIADATIFIENVRTLGVRIALDDFGAGASSFGYLKMLKVDTLKIDGQFIRGVIDDPLDAAAVRCFVDIADVMNLQTVAECVEDQTVYEHLSKLGLDLLQGFHLHHPEPIEQVLKSNCAIEHAV